MKTKILLFFLAFSTVAGLQAQEKVNFLHLGLSGSPYRGVGIVGSANFNVADNVSVGPLVMLRVGVRSTAFYRYTTAFIGVGVKGDYSFDELLNIPKEFDVYAGGQAGWVFTPGRATARGIYASNPYYTTTINPGSYYGVGYPFVAAEVGGRWHWKDNMSLFVEVTGGWSASGARGGIAFKL